ncbi:MAG: 4-hydroxythreonine-4-phosphate dehydrogenase PdxA [Deltaproteobacteria bacterium]|nr:4-hydroxythreonine-4-phosphate dehydrogenase PdxA [Deltaproteobacteria bacterium]
MPKHKPTIAITLGDPQGIGPEIVKKALRDPRIKKLAHWKIFGSPFRKKLSPKESGRAALAALEEAITAIKRRECDALVTAPISKKRIRLAGCKFPGGHTEYLARRFGAGQSAMMLTAGSLRVVLVTIHVPLKKVPRLISTQKILEKIVLTNESLKKDFAIKKPRIAVCGLNPHAGEGGIFGNEEKRVIRPALTKAKRLGINVSGPEPPDTVFYWACKGRFDAVICQYHDQGLIALKTLAFHEGVNITLGLPIVRTSPDHGCAFDIAGKGVADPSSMKAAMKTCVKVWGQRRASARGGQK